MNAAEGNPARTAVDFVVLTVLIAVAISPALVVDIPAIADYPNNLARMYILSLAGSPAENPFYEVKVALIPNLAMDLLVPQFVPLVSVASATKAFFILSQILIVSGAVAIEIAVKGRHQIAGYAALTTIFSTPFVVGLMNFEFAMGVALWGVASWIILENSRLAFRFLVHSIIVFLLFLGHFLALGIYGAAIGLYELHRVFRRGVYDRDIRILAILATPALLMLVAMWLSGGSVGSGKIEWSARVKALWICCSLNGYSIELSAATIAALLITTLILCMRKGVAFSESGRWIGAGFLILFIAFPVRLFGSFYADIRVLVGAMLILPAFINLSARKENETRVIGASFVAILSIVNTMFTAHVWMSYRKDFENIISSFDSIAPKSLVIVGSTEDNMVGLAGDPFRHAPTLAVHYAKALVPGLFAIQGSQPVKLRGQYKAFDFGDPGLYDPIPASILTSIAREHGAWPVPPVIARWTENFDYLYLLGSPGPNPLPDVLRETAVGARFVLYQIRK